jgi:hypothetical protein
MNSHPTQDAILAELGDKVTAAIAVSVSAAHDDLVTYREQHAGWVADHSERGLANWIHDRVWAHLMQRLDGEAEITVVDHEPTRVVRVVGVGMKYLMRVKRHGLDDKISTYPTQTALQFYMQGEQSLFPEMVEVRLAADYLWNPETRSIGDAVISMRDGVDNVVWSVVIGLEPGTGAVAIRPMPTGPVPPVVDVAGERLDQADQAP